MNITHVIDILNWWPYDSQIVVAGSAAICPVAAGDVDVWFIGDRQVSLPPAGLFEPLELNEVTLNTIYPPGASFRVVANGVGHEGVRIQLLKSSCRTVEGLLDTFDLSCHAFAINRNTERWHHPRATLPGLPMHALNVTDWDMTAARWAKFTQRYRSLEALHAAASVA